MDQRRRNQILIIGSLLLIAVLPYLRPKSVDGPWEWDWATVADGPTDALPHVTAEEKTAVRVLAGSDAGWVVELLVGAGLRGVAIGPASTHRDEVWVLAADPDCDHAAAAAEHLRAGGPLVTWTTCPDVLAALELAPPATWEAGATVATVGPLRDLALPGSGREWVDDGDGLTATRAGGAAVALQRDHAAIFGFDVARFLLELRQGEADLAGIDTDGEPGLTAADLRPFPWSSPTWRTPSADAWTDVLAASVDAVRGEARPRLWPLPTDATSAIVLSLDPEETPAGPILARTQAAGGELTVLASFKSEIATSTLRRMERWGHGLGVASDARDAASPQDIEAVIRGDVGRVPLPRAIGNRGYRWWGWDAPPRLYSELGVWVELDHVGLSSSGAPGFRFGGGRALRAWSPSGPLAVLSLPVQVDDRALAEVGPERAALGVANLVEAASVHRVPVTARLHGDQTITDVTVLDALLQSATAAGLPVLSADRYATWAWVRHRTLLGQPAAADVPLWVWDPTAECEVPIAWSALGATGCLRPLR